MRTYKVDVMRRETVSTATLPGNVVDFSDGGSVSPDGQEIILALDEEISDVWLMQDFDPLASAKVASGRS